MIDKITTMKLRVSTKKRMRKFEQHRRETDEEVLLHLLEDVEKIYSNKEEVKEK